MKTPKEVANQLGINILDLRAILRVFKFEKIFGQWLLNQKDIEKIKEITKK